MDTLTLHSDERMAAKWASYPPYILPKLQRLRTLILAVARASGSIVKLEETLKWGEPSYLTKGGSTVRLDWKAKQPSDAYLQGLIW